MFLIDQRYFNLLKYGIFALNKNSGISSAKSLEIVKEVITRDIPYETRSKELRAGHGGTLDETASGVLVVGLCYGCKLLPSFLHGTKSYFVVGKLGEATDTYNDTGNITNHGDYSSLTDYDIAKVLPNFEGHIMQVPPKYSALKKNGKRISDLTRNGINVEMKPRPAICHKITLKSFNPPFFSMNVDCGPGFYIRSLVHDIGKNLGSFAHVTTLQRTQQGPFNLQSSLRMEQLSLETVVAAVKSTKELLNIKNQNYGCKT